jgi:hypothetical protein
MLAVTAAYYLAFGVPFIPTPHHIADAMIGLVPWKGGETVIDLGAGDGSLLEAVKKARPDTTVRGCEIVPTVWLLGVLRSFIRQSGVKLRLKSMFRENISDADVVFLYLFPHVIEELKAKLDHELRPGAYVVCQTFGFKDVRPLKEVRMLRLGGEVSVYLYQWKAGM